MSKLTDEIANYIIDPDGIDSVETKIPQGLLRRVSMRIRQLEAEISRYELAAELQHSKDLARMQ